MLLSLYTTMSSRTAEEREKFNALNTQVTVIRYQVDTLLAAGIQRAWDAGSVLHRPEPKFAERDRLLEGWRKHELNDADKMRLMLELDRLRRDVEEPDSVRTLASEILRAMEQQGRDQMLKPK
jgi:hypothetical protein